MDNYFTNLTEFNNKNSREHKIKSISKFPISLKNSNSDKLKIDSFDSSYNNRHMFVQNYKSKSTQDLHNSSTSNYNFTKKSHSNSTSVSTIDFKRKNEGLFIQMKMGEFQFRIQNLKKNLFKKNKEIEKLENELKELKNKKELKKRELEDFLSNKESLEEIMRVLLHDNVNSQREIYTKITLDKNEIINCSNEKFNEILKNTFEDLKISNVEKIIEIIKVNFQKKNLIKEGKVDLFLGEIIMSLKKVIKETFNENQIHLLLKYIIKISYFDKKINDTFNFIKKIYKDQKKEIKEKLIESLHTKQKIEEKLIELNNLMEELDKKKYIFDNSKNKFKKKENKLEIPNYKILRKIYNSSKTTSRIKKINYFKTKTNTYNSPNLSTEIQQEQYKLTYNSNNISTDYNQHLRVQTSPISTVTSSRFNLFTNKIINKNKNNNNRFEESFCYYKIFNKYERRFNPLNIIDRNPEFLGYNKGLLSIDFSNKQLIFSKSNNDDNKKIIYNNKIFKIEYKKIRNILIPNAIREIIKVYNFYLKYNKTCEKEFNNSIKSLNRFIHLKELNNIKMDDNQKIKAALCKYFSFLIIFSEEKNLEIIFINYEEFKYWYNGISLIVKDNKKLYNNENDIFIKNKINHKKSKSNSFKIGESPNKLSKNTYNYHI